MNREQMKAVLDKIKAYEKIIIFRHKRPDGDAVGGFFASYRALSAMPRSRRKRP